MAGIYKFVAIAPLSFVLDIVDATLFFLDLDLDPLVDLDFANHVGLVFCLDIKFLIIYRIVD